MIVGTLRSDRRCLSGGRVRWVMMVDGIPIFIVLLTAAAMALVRLSV
jgi:hypothetical protein